MVHEEFLLFHDEDTPQGEYLEDEDKIVYYMAHVTENLEDLISHEWLHALLSWATDGETTGEKDHFIMKVINFI